MLEAIKNELNKTTTENDALAFRSAGTACMDFFALCGALRCDDDGAPEQLFIRAYAENRDYAVRTLFYLRDVRGGLGERDTFRRLIRLMANMFPDSMKKNIENVPEYGRYDDLLLLLDTPCEAEAAAFIKAQLERDLSDMYAGKSVSLLAKWLPSVNTSSKATRERARKLCSLLSMSQKEYRGKLSALRHHIDIIESRITRRDYTFDYEKQCSGAMFKYRTAFRKNDGERYTEFLEKVKQGKAVLKTASLYPYDIVRACERFCEADERGTLDTTWRSLPDYTDGRNALAVVDGSGSMYGANHDGVRPIDVAVSLGIYFAERNTGLFRNHFINFSMTPQLIEIKGEDIYEKVNFCKTYDEVANTDIEAVFILILKAALNSGAKPEEMPETLYIISDMEFDDGIEGDPDKTIFQNMRDLYESHGYKLPTLIYWNVFSHGANYPVTENEVGAVLVSGCSPSVFKAAVNPGVTPKDFMLQIINSERYINITA